MRAIRISEFGGPEKLSLQSVEDPEPQAGEYLVQVRAAGVNPVDTYIRSGLHAVKPPLPYTPGADGAGVVVSAGEGAHRFRIDERVYLAGSRTGSYAQLAVCSDAQVHALPEPVSFAQGAALGVPYVTAYRALFQVAKAKPGESVLVHGATGGVGLAALQFGAGAGLTMLGTAGTEAGSALLKAQGATQVLRHGVPEFASQLLAATEGRGVDVILEMRADLNLGVDLQCLSRRGRVVVVGSRGPVQINPRDVMTREASIYGVFLFGTPAEDLARAHAAIGAALRSGLARPVIAREFPLEEAVAAHQAVLEPGAHGKIVLIP